MRRIGAWVLLLALCAGVVVMIDDIRLFGDRSSSVVVVAEMVLVGLLVFALTYLIRPRRS